ncbi:MAG: 5-methylthioadenosine/S-adenosylhomocysteine deaminase [Pelotomaculum sp. PtaB.Bin013]|uniref:5-methylthioadenosine/S-adenosylhomocysteine deaminase n=1 Tax=Pelotomaculum isophthalicicum JI TaxID=947010 RepID=A0A9X4JV06_9FIRM|nr:amidohydrolase [Pelotomaculum isophthalicicum]MDF9407346.1 amidohydrolase [Pelotomaculum isophthalicicum JI]OPX91920.1 MAG: 5-methylthioadenosine/S-adenosylhomocysteine deaminase [Pelotomaculum sp. PtaB.Bin013]
MADILIQGVSVLTMEGSEDIIENGDILIKGDRIAALGPYGSVSTEEQAKRVIDGSGKIAMPGFVNCHTHAAMTMLRSYADDMPLMEWLSEKIWPVEDKLEPEDIYWGTMLCCLEMIKSGTTTFADMYFIMDQVALAVEKSGLRACLSRGLIGNGPNAGLALEENINFFKEWNDGAGGRIKVMFGPHAPYTCPPEYLKQVIELAGKYGAGLHIHVAETKSEVEQINASYGRTPVGHLDSVGLFELPVLAAHCVHLDNADIEILARNNVGVAHCPESNMKLASGAAPVAGLLEAGVCVGLGTDGAASNNNLDMLEEMRSAAMLQKVNTGDPTVMPAFTALRTATANGARVLGLAGEIGMLKTGMKADLILINKHRPHFCPQHNLIANLVYAGHSTDVDTVIVDGKILMENRRVLTIDEEEVMREAQIRADRLVG